MSTATLPLRVVRKWNETPEICGFELRSLDGAALPAFTAGAHIDVHIPGGLVRQYSLCNTPLDRSCYVIGVLREPASRGGSVAMHERVSEGDCLEVSPARNLFPLSPDARRHLLFAGGIGLTPLLSMAEQLLADGAEFELHVSARTRSRLPFAERLLAPDMARHVRMHLDDGDADQQLDLDAVLKEADPRSHLYVCGPKGYIDWVLGAAIQAGWAAERLHKEHFSNGAAAQAKDAVAFEVLLARSGKVVSVAADCSIVGALADAGVEVPVSCGEGICGTCLTRVIDGTPDHRDLFLGPEEQARNDQMTPCCSRSKSARLVLDL
jgi:vanillate O-demethylase ferredoxin subunit